MTPQIMFVNVQLQWQNVRVVKSVPVEHVSVSNDVIHIRKILLIYFYSNYVSISFSSL